MQPISGDLVVVIDDQIQSLIEEINDAPQHQQQTRFVDEFQNMMIDQLMGPFGLTRAMFDDRDGGAITTLQNFEKGIAANDADDARHASWKQANEKSFERKDYDAALNAAHDDMRSADGKFYDGYKVASEIPEGPRMDARDHVISASSIERSAKGQLGQTREERVMTATLDDNVVLTAFNMNCSKGEKDLLEWAALPSSKDPSKTNAEYFEVDEQTLLDKYKKATKAVGSTQNRALFSKQSGEFLVEGAKASGKLVIRQILGLLLKDLIDGLVQDVRYLVSKGLAEAKPLMQLVKERIQATYERIKLKWADYLKEGASAGISGFLSTFVTLIINSFITTAKNLVRMIREAVLSIVRAVKLIMAPPPGTESKDIAVEVAKILASSIALCVGIALEEVIQKALEAIPVLLPFAATIAPVITGVVTGALTLFTVMAFDRLRDSFAFQNKQLADVHRGQAVGLLKIKQSMFMLDSAYRHVIVTTEMLRVTFAEDWFEVQAMKAVTTTKAADYRKAVDSLDDLLELF
ncbi:hypothetical protein V2K50_00340 [Pseudomonas alliivorans]|nr:hypothetical protein [Pseudomonas alliivorans]